MQPAFSPRGQDKITWCLCGGSNSGLNTRNGFVQRVKWVRRVAGEILDGAPREPICGRLNGRSHILMRIAAVFQIRRNGHLYRACDRFGGLNELTCRKIPVAAP